MAVGKVERDNELLKLRCKKYEIRSLFSLIIFTGISVFSEAFLLHQLSTSLTISSRQIKLKLNVGLVGYTILFLIAFMRAWFLY